MPQRSIGLDIGTAGVRAAQLSVAGGAVVLERFGQLALPDGAVRDGEVLDPGAVGAVVKRLWAEVGFSSQRVTVGVANQRVVVRQVDLPWLPPKELRASLALTVADHVPMPVDQALLDVHPVEERVVDGARVVRGLLVAAARDTVLGTLAAVEAAGLQPARVDLTPFAVLRALAAPDHLGLGAPVEALVDVGARVTNIVVHQGGVPRFVRILLGGGQDLTDAVAARLGVPAAEAEAVKQRLGTGDGAPEEHARAGRALDAAVGSFVDEVRGSLDYFAASSAHGPIAHLRLSGGGSRLTGLAARLHSATRIPVEPGDPLRDLSLGRTGLSTEQLAHVTPLAAVPVGLALGAAA